MNSILRQCEIERKRRAQLRVVGGTSSCTSETMDLIKFEKMSLQSSASEANETVLKEKDIITGTGLVVFS
jgi:hypothetical protein